MVEGIGSRDSHAPGMRPRMRLGLRVVVAGVAVATAALGVSVANAGEAPPNEVTASVIGGQQVSSAPWAVQVFKSGELACSGTMIADRWVLTAAHCHLDSVGTETVKVGAVEIGRGIDAAVTEIKIQHDVALFKLDRSIKTEFVKLAATDPPEGATVEIYGYGGQKPLRTAKNRVVNVQEHGWLGRVINTEEIDGDPEGGDSGGPAFYKGEQVAELFGQSEFNQYSSIAAHREWIRSVASV